MESSSIRSFARSSAANRLPRQFYERDTLQVARDLLGKVLAVQLQPKSPVAAVRIVETEAYHGTDPASHCARGPTPRCAVMFDKPGVAYVYFIYGMYRMLNFVTERKGYPGAVLIRAVEPLCGEALMEHRRSGRSRADWTNGPGRLTQALGIELSHNGVSLEGPVFSVFDDGFVSDRISVSPRVGITQAVHEPWRFFVTGNSFVSKAPQNAKSRVIRG